MITGEKSEHASVSANHLAIDPGAIGAGEERDGSGDVLRRAQPLERIQFRHVVDQLLRFSVQKQVGRGRAWRNGVDRDRSPAKFLGEDRS